MSASEDKKVETTVVEEKETKKVAKKSEEVVVKSEIKVEEPKEPKKAKNDIDKKQFVVGAKVIDKSKDEFEIVSLPVGELFNHSKIVLKDKSGNLNVQLKGKLQLV